LIADATDLPLLLRGRHHSSTSLRRLTVITAQLAGLVSLTLLKLNDAGGARRWGRTARRAAADAADPATSSWVWAQEAYRHFYAGDLIEAVTVARHAQDLAAGAACVGVSLAAALEARAHAAMGAAASTRAALDRAEHALGGLDPAAVTESAFGYNEAQLRFHQGNACTHLGNTAEAYRAQEQALRLYPDSDYLDRALVCLDRARCLAADGDVRAAAHEAVDVLAALSGEQRAGMVLVRAAEIYRAVPAPHRALAPVRELRDALTLSTPYEEERP
jgi:tetratricopeptide (TPR) repeat protein